MTLLHTDEHEGRVAILTLSDPSRRNALSLELSGQLAGAIAECDRDESVHAVVITGAPPAFCAGADLAALATAGRSGSEADLRGI
jgi:enoyl-CoA hydratase